MGGDKSAVLEGLYVEYSQQSELFGRSNYIVSGLAVWSGSHSVHPFQGRNETLSDTFNGLCLATDHLVIMLTDCMC